MTHSFMDGNANYGPVVIARLLSIARKRAPRYKGLGHRLVRIDKSILIFVVILR